jgi:hypothetical protein
MNQEASGRLLAVAPLLAAIALVASAPASSRTSARPDHVVSVVANDSPPIIRGKGTAVDQAIPTEGLNAFTFNRRVDAGPVLSEFLKI